MCECHRPLQGELLELAMTDPEKYEQVTMHTNAS